MHPLYSNQVFGQEPNSLAPFITYDEINQKYNTTCAIRSQQIILRDYGIDIPQEELMRLAEENCWWTEDGGTRQSCVGYILQSQGIDCHQAYDCTVYDLMDELSKGHRVIVGVDSGELWAERNHDFTAAVNEQLEDIFIGECPDHALIVAGIKVDTDNPSDVSVIITDPGTGDLRLEYPLNEFLDAWKDSNCFMCATDEPAPYQYDENLHAMVPSNFACDNYIADAAFPLSDADIYTPIGYTPYYNEGHLDFIGCDSLGNAVPYDKFREVYLDCSGDAGGLEESMNNLFGFSDDTEASDSYGADSDLPETDFDIDSDPDGGFNVDIDGCEFDSDGAFDDFDMDIL
ncbi:hypothetical protein IJT93_01295 [bacterium]|nr:hypothetical protein [bacterium]